ncbi:MAG TPA: DMT family transporter [Actinomycetota bacterium]|jgi:drug/metabolite transporter (DMT)-like permease
MIYGLGAALCWGLADFGAAILSRRTGSFRALLIAQIGAVAFMTALVPAGLLHGGLGWAAAALALTGVVGTVAYFGLFRGLERGPVAIVSPITASYAAVTVILAVVLLHEPLSAGEAAGVIVTILGVALATTNPRLLRRAGATRVTGPTGIGYALLSTVVFGVGTFVLGYYAQRFGWFTPIYVSRPATLATLLVLLALPRGRVPWVSDRPPGPVAGITIVAALAIGIADVVGLFSYTRGSELGFVAIAAAATAVFPLIPVAGGMILFGERPAAVQLIGVAAVVAGLLLLGLSA